MLFAIKWNHKIATSEEREKDAAGSCDHFQCYLFSATARPDACRTPLPNRWHMLPKLIQQLLNFKISLQGT